MKIFIGTVATVLMATISFFVFAFHSVKIPEDNQAITCGTDTIAIEVDTLSLKATEKMDSKTTTTKPTPTTTVNTTSVDMTSVNTTSTTWTTPMEKVETTESMEVTTSSAAESELAKITAASSSETTASTFTTVNSTEATVSSSVTTTDLVKVYKTLTISDSVTQTSGTLHLLLTDSENNCFTSEAEVSEDGYVTFIFQSDDEHLITSGIYKCSCIELASVTTINLD